MSAQIGTESLAIDGGRPVRTEPMPPWPWFDEEQVEAAAAVLRSGKVNQWTGELVRAFEAAFARAFGMPHAVAVTNGSLAIELALRAFSVGEGDDVVVTPRSFLASASSAEMVGARSVFCDIDPKTGLMTPATIAAALTPATKAVIVVHLCGRPCDMPGIMALADERGLIVIEDCAQSHGARIGGRHLGSFGHASAFSFCQDKIMTTGGEGGMVLFSDADRYEFAWSFKDHGKSRSKMLAKGHPPGYRWVHDSIGSNWRMLEIQAAIGLIQLRRLAEWRATRARNAETLIATLSQFPAIAVEPLPAGHDHAWYRVDCRVDMNWLKPGWDRDRIMAALAAEGVPCLVGACPELYREGAYASRGNEAPQPNAAALGRVSLVFLAHPTLDEATLADWQTGIAKVLSAASRS